MGERIQKLLAARGVGSRRRIESWIAAGRITVNGKPAAKGQPIDDGDDVRLDGRRLRLARGTRAAHQGMIYHRPAQEEIRPDAKGTSLSSVERLPRSAARRWIPVSPLAPRDGGLELFLTDGALAAALTRRGMHIPSEYSVRVRGAFDETRIEATIAAATGGTPLEGRVTKAASAGGEGTNRWLRVRTIGLRARDLRKILEDCGLVPNRILRTSYGPISMDRVLARGRSRQLTEAEMRALREAAGLQPTGSRVTRR